MEAGNETENERKRENDRTKERERVTVISSLTAPVAMPTTEWVKGGWRETGGWSEREKREERDRWM